MRRYCILVTVLVCSAVLTGCLSRGRESVISTDRFISAMDEYDAEEYDSYDEMFEQTDNSRAMLAGMYCRVEPESSLITDELVFIQGLTNEDGSNVNIKASLYDFENEEDASEYYQSCCGLLDEQYDDDGWETLTEDLSQGDLSCTCSISFRRLNLGCTAVYQEYDHVLILHGIEFKTNEMSSYFEELCGLLDIPSPGLSDYDCNGRLLPEERVPMLCCELDAEEMDAADFDLNWVLKDEGCYYVETDDFASIAGSLDEGRLAMYDGAEKADFFFCIDSDPEDQWASRYVVMRVVFGTDEQAESFYGSMMEDIELRATKTYEVTGSGETDGITYTKYRISDPYMSASYDLYFEGNSAYVLSFLNMDPEIASETIQHVCDIMGLP